MGGSSLQVVVMAAEAKVSPARTRISQSDDT